MDGVLALAFPEMLAIASQGWILRDYTRTGGLLSGLRDDSVTAGLQIREID
jgi:hypothetical protein